MSSSRKNKPSSNFLKENGFIKRENYWVFDLEKNKDTNESNYVTVPITGGEYTVLLRLLMSATPNIIGWD